MIGKKSPFADFITILAIGIFVIMMSVDGNVHATGGVIGSFILGHAYAKRQYEEYYECI